MLKPMAMIYPTYKVVFPVPIVLICAGSRMYGMRWSFLWTYKKHSCSLQDDHTFILGIIYLLPQ